MNVDRRSKLRKSPGSARVIEVDMTQKDIPDITRFVTQFP